MIQLASKLTISSVNENESWTVNSLTVKGDKIGTNILYYGESERNLFVRASEHLGMTPLTGKRVRNPKKSAVFDHILLSGSSLFISSGSSLFTPSRSSLFISSGSSLFISSRSSLFISSGSSLFISTESSLFRPSGCSLFTSSRSSLFTSSGSSLFTS